MLILKTNKGGKRKGAGRKPAFSCKTTTVAFRVPVSHEHEFKQRAKDYLLSLKYETSNTNRTT